MQCLKTIESNKPKYSRVFHINHRSNIKPNSIIYGYTGKVQHVLHVCNFHFFLNCVSSTYNNK